MKKIAWQILHSAYKHCMGGWSWNSFLCYDNFQVMMKQPQESLMPRRCLISVARNLPREKILRLTGLFPQNGSKFHSGNDDNSVFFHKGNGVFFQRPFRNLPGVLRYGGIGHARGYVWKGYVHTCFYALPYTFRCTTGVQDLAVTEARLLLHCSLYTCPSKPW